MEQKAWIISVNMGYGHQRTAFPLKDLAPEGKIIAANDYPLIPKKDREIWEGSRRFYEFVSRFKRIPFIGLGLFSIYNQFQKILNFYPRRDLSKPNFLLKQTYSLIKKGWGKDLIEKLKVRPLPLISTFFTPAFMADFFKYPGNIFCVVCDADVSRAWAPLNPKTSKIKYFAPTSRAVERLKLYGVKPENIFLTGYPLPTEIPEILKDDLRFRFLNLDPKGRYLKRYLPLVKKYLGDLPSKSDHPLTLMFAVGGAGAQKEIGIKIVRSLKNRIRNGRIKIILVAGIREKVNQYFQKKLKNLGLGRSKNIEIIFERNIEDYFRKFNRAIKKTDILWTKPSELSFYTALGLPLILAPSIGSQEDLNREWLLELGSGMNQKNPKYTDQWLFDLLDSGWFAEAAMDGFIEAEKMGKENIKQIVFSS
jgi:UDP-N-acetylglucosamine:LPS N-acetylglucosamine transferase